MTKALEGEIEHKPLTIFSNLSEVQYSLVTFDDKTHAPSTPFFLGSNQQREPYFDELLDGLLWKNWQPYILYNLRN